MSFTPFVEVARPDGTPLTVAIDKIVMFEKAERGLRLHLAGAEEPITVDDTRESLLDRIRAAERTLQDELD